MSRGCSSLTLPMVCRWLNSALLVSLETEGLTNWRGLRGRRRRVAVRYFNCAEPNAVDTARPVGHAIYKRITILL